MSEIMTPERIAKADKALEAYLVYHGAVHEDECPGDDTCECEWKWMNDGANDSYRLLTALAGEVATLTARVQRLETALRAELDCLPESSWAKSSTYQRLAAALGDA